MIDLGGRTVLITGANRGIGRGIALRCAASGGHVVVTSRRRDAAEGVVKEINDRGGRGLAVECDVTVADDVERAIDAAVRETGALHAVVHNATHVLSGIPIDPLDVDVALWQEHVMVSIRAVFYLGQAAFPHLRDSHGTMVLFTSPAGIEGSGEISLYSMVKAAQRTIVKSLAREWGPDGITVNSLAPLALTDAMEEHFVVSPELAARLLEVVPLGRIGDPETDIGAATVFLCSEDARYVSGQTLFVSGGRFTSL